MLPAAIRRTGLARLVNLTLVACCAALLSLSACGGGGAAPAASLGAPTAEAYKPGAAGTGAPQAGTPRMSASTLADQFIRQSQASPLSIKRRTPPAAEISAPSGAPSLPPIDTLSRQGSEATSKFLYGAEFDLGLPNARLIVNQETATFAPAGQDLSQAALGIYHFELPDFTGEPGVDLDWEIEPPTGDCFLAIADYNSKQWKWFPFDGQPPVVFPGSIDFVSPGDQIYVAVLCVGTALSKLTSITFGQDLPPVPKIRPLFGFMQPGTNYFAAVDSSDDIGLSKLEWDLDNDGTYEVVDSGIGAVQADYMTPGTQTVKLRATDTTGQTAIASFEFEVDTPGYDEIEPNNTLAEAQPLPLSCLGWEGNLGAGGYDGGDNDYYKVVAPQTLRLEFHLFPQNAAVYQMGLVDTSGNTLFTGTTEAQGSDLFCSTVPAGTYILVVTSQGAGNSDYALDGFAIYQLDYDEVEDNDSAAQADVFDSEQSYFGNLGAAGYDGDREDWWKYQTGPAGEGYAISVLFDPAAVDIDIDLVDDQGQTITSSAGTADETLILTSTAPGETYYIKIYVYPQAPADAMGDYVLRLIPLGPIPHAVLEVNPFQGAQPLAITLDASQSTAAPGHTIVQYQWDSNGDGKIDAATTEPTLTRAIYDAGVAVALVYVIQDNGLSHAGGAQFDSQGGYQESEPNDVTVQADELTSFPFSDYYGHIGPSTMAANDVDVYHYGGFTGTTYNFFVASDKDVLLIGASLFNAAGDELDADDNSDGALTLSNTAAANDNYYVVVFTAIGETGQAGYMLSGTVD